jgi:hypothetical protein
LVSAGDPGAEINVFFMPWEGTEDRRPSRMLVKDEILFARMGCQTMSVNAKKFISIIMPLNFQQNNTAQWPIDGKRDV